MNEDINDVDPRQFLQIELQRAIKASLDQKTYIGTEELARIICTERKDASIIAHWINEIEKENEKQGT